MVGTGELAPGWKKAFNPEPVGHLRRRHDLRRLRAGRPESKPGVYTIVGGGSALDSKGQGGWLDRYGDGGGSSKVSFIGEVETQFGTLTRGTFVIARKMDGKTNSHSPADAITVLVGGALEFHGDSAFRPMNPDRSTRGCSDYPFSSKYVFTADLATLSCASCTHCVAAVPCPD